MVSEEIASCILLPIIIVLKKPAPPNKCLTKNGGCTAHSTCSHKKGKITCTCKKGYVVKGNKCARKYILFAIISR